MTPGFHRSVLTGACLVISALYGQQQQTPTTPPATTTPSPGRTTTPTPTTQPNTNTNNNRMDNTMDRPIFLSGKVQVSDGGALPQNIAIERVCNGNRHIEAYADSKGNFSFQLGQNRSYLQDASISSASETPFGGFNTGGMNNTSAMNSTMTGGTGISERDLMGCDLRAAAPGYQSEIVTLSGRRMFDNPDVGTILLHRLGKVEGTTISATSLAAPKDAKKALERARDAMKKNKSDEAQKQLAKALEGYPHYAEAWYELGLLQQQEKKPAEARTSWGKAMEVDPKYIKPYLSMAFLAAADKKWDEVITSTDKALKLDAFDYPQAHFYRAIAEFNLRNMDEAEKSAREAVKLDNIHQYPKASHLLGIILAEKREYTAAATEMKNYLKFAPKAEDMSTVRTQIAELEKAAVKPPEPPPQQAAAQPQAAPAPQENAAEREAPAVATLQLQPEDSLRPAAVRPAALKPQIVDGKVHSMAATLGEASAEVIGTPSVSPGPNGASISRFKFRGEVIASDAQQHAVRLRAGMKHSEAFDAIRAAHVDHEELLDGFKIGSTSYLFEDGILTEIEN